MSELVKNEAAFKLLSDLIIKQIEAISKACTYLNDLKKSIESNDLEALKHLIQHNDIPLAQIEEHEKSRFSLIHQYGFDNTVEGFTQCIKTFDNDKKSLSRLQDRLSDVMHELQVATKVSDILVTKNKQRVKQALSILTGTSLLKDHTYSSSGNKKADSLTRPLAIA